MPVFELEETTATSDEDRKEFVPTIFDEDTIVEAEVVEVKSKIAPWKNDDGSDVPRVEFTFSLPDYNQKVWGETPTTFSSHPDCKLKGWAQEILGGQELPVGYRLNTDTLKGRKCRVRLGYKKYYSQKKQKDVETNPVVDVLHARVPVQESFQEEPF